MLGMMSANAVAPVEIAKDKVAVVYFSWSGNTRFAATTIAKEAGAATFEIKAETPYNSDFNKCCDEAKPECYGKKLRPIKTIDGLDLTKYETVFVGSPNWWGHACAARAYVAHAECRRPQRQDRMPVPDARRRRNAEPRTRLCRVAPRIKGAAAQGVRRLVHQVQRQGA